MCVNLKSSKNGAGYFLHEIQIYNDTVCGRCFLTILYKGMGK